MSDFRGSLFTDTDFDLGNDMVQKQHIFVSTGPMRWEDKDFITASFIELPLSDDGQSVDKILALVLKV